MSLVITAHDSDDNDPATGLCAVAYWMGPNRWGVHTVQAGRTVLMPLLVDGDQASAVAACVAELNDARAERDLPAVVHAPHGTKVGPR